MIRPVLLVPRVALLALVCLIVCLQSTALATIFRWDDGEPIAGTETITVGPGMIVDGLELQFADLFEASLTAASFVGTDLSDGLLDGSMLANANFSDAVLTGASFQFADATGANFANADLQFAFLDAATLVEADFSNADLRDAGLIDAMVADADFTGALVNGTIFDGSDLAEEQLYTTGSYLQKNLQGISLFLHDLSGWDFSGQDLTGADLSATDLTGANLTGAIIADSLLGSVTGLTEEQFASTASYQQENLQDIDLSNNDLTGWDFSGQDLSRTGFERATLAGADFADAIVEGTRFDSTVMDGFTKEQLYSTASYQQKQLQRIRLRSNNLDGWDFSGQDLRGANLTSTSLVGTDFSLADLRGAQGFDPDQTTILRNTIDPDSILINLELEPGETLVAGAGGFLGLPVAFFGQFSIDPTAKVDLTDNTAIVYQAPADAVRAQLLAGRGGSDLVGAWNGNGLTSSTAAAVNETDPGSRSIGYARNGDLPLGPYEEFHGFPVEASSVLVAYTRTGDANLDGVVDDADVTIVSAEYAPGVPKPHWALGDFDYNGFVDDTDVTLLGVFYDPMGEPLPTPVAGTTSIAAVPEPGTVALLMTSVMAVLLRRVVRRKSR